MVTTVMEMENFRGFRFGPIITKYKIPPAIVAITQKYIKTFLFLFF